MKMCIRIKYEKKKRNDTLWFRFYIRMFKYWRSMLLYIKYRDRAILPPGDYRICIVRIDSKMLPNGTLEQTMICKDMDSGNLHKYKYVVPPNKYKFLNL